MDAAVLPPTLHGLALEPATLRPGAITRLTFTVRNRSAVIAPPLHLRFLVPPELEPLDATIVDVAPIGAGEERTIACRARVSSGVRDGSPIAVQAAITYAGREVGSNVATAYVCAEPQLQGPGTSFTLAESVDGGVRLDVSIRNDGDGIADDVVVAVPPQPGLAASAHVTLAVGSIAPGDVRTTSAVLDVAPGSGAIAVDGIVLRDARGRRTLVPGRASLELTPRLAPPVLTLIDDGDRVRVRVDIAAGGPSHLTDVELRVQLSDGVRLAPASMRFDGAPVVAAPRRGKRLATVRHGGAEPTVTINRITAGEPSSLTFDVHRAAAGGHVNVSVRAHGTEQRATAAIAPLPEQPPRLRLISAPAPIVAGGRASFTVELAAMNHATTVGCLLEGAELVAIDDRAPVAIALAAGEVREVRIDVLCSAAVSHDVVLSAESTGGTCSLTVPVLVRGADYDATNADDATRSSTVRVDAVLHVPEHATAGGTFEAALAIRAHVPVREICITASPDGILSVLPGSTTIDGHDVLDGDGPAIAAGLVLRDLPAGTETTITWRTRIDAAATGVVAHDVLVVADGDACAIAPAPIAIEQPDMFGARPSGFAFHVEAPLAPCAALPQREPAPATVAETAAPSAAEVEPFVPLAPAGSWTSMWTPLADAPHADPIPVPLQLRATFGPHAAADAVRLLEGGTIAGLVSHVLALRLLVPTEVTPFDHTVADALERCSGALRDVLDRLFVKIRIPAYDISGFDCEDTATRTAFSALAAALPSETPGVARWSDALRDAPIGDPAALAGFAALVQPGDDPASQRAHEYAASIAATLNDYAASDPLQYDAALAHASVAVLDEARAAFLFELRATAHGAVR